jgi:exodeoxyribonuclease III
MKITSFNINGLRAREHQLDALKLDSAFIGLQEIKVHDEMFPLDMAQNGDFHADYHGQKSHYGVANLANVKSIACQKGFAWRDEDAQRRLIISTFNTSLGKPLTIINGYFPQGENEKHETKYPAKREYYADLLQLLNDTFSVDDLVIVMGDINISAGDNDIGIGPVNAKRWLKQGKCSFLPEERQWYKTLTDWGLVDSFRMFFPDVSDRFSWFDYRSKGFADEPKRGLRIDQIMLSPALKNHCLEAGIDYDIRAMEKPSDHAPIWAKFDFEIID